jgi:hypothetical protein
MKISKTILMAALCVCAPAFAGEKPAKCLVDAGYDAQYQGPCLFKGYGKGSFIISPRFQNGRFVDGISFLSVDIYAKNHANVRVMLEGGISSNWGDAIRSKTQPACWIGDDFKICAW